MRFRDHRASSGENDIVVGDYSAVAFNNAGTFTSSAPVGVYIDFPLVNSGSVIVQQGFLDVPNFANSGTVTVGPGWHLSMGVAPLRARSSSPLETRSRQRRARRSPLA